MRVWIIETEVLLSPWNEHVAKARVEDQTLYENLVHTVHALEARATVERLKRSDARLHTPCTVDTLLVYDNVWCSYGLLKTFVLKARRCTSSSILALDAEDRMVKFSQTLQNLGVYESDQKTYRIYPLLWIRAGETLPKHDDLTTLSSNSIVPLCIDLRTEDRELPVHKVFSPDETLILPFTSRAIVRIDHWMHVLRANQLARLVWGARLVRDEPWRLLWAVLRAWSINPWKVLGKLVKRGKGCDIHPTAVVEGCVLGDNVKIGAYAVVRFSYLANDAYVGESAQVISSVLGKGASVSRMGLLQSTVLYPKANTSSPGYQLCVVGTETFLGHTTFLADFKPEGTIKVQNNGKFVDSETNLLGCAVGHHCRLMMGASIYPGREIPNGYTILGPTENVVAKIPYDLPSDGTPLVGVGGTLQALKRAAKNTTQGEV